MTLPPPPFNPPSRWYTVLFHLFINNHNLRTMHMGESCPCRHFVLYQVGDIVQSSDNFKGLHLIFTTWVSCFMPPFCSLYIKWWHTWSLWQYPPEVANLFLSRCTSHSRRHSVLCHLGGTRAVIFDSNMDINSSMMGLIVVHHVRESLQAAILLSASWCHTGGYFVSIMEINSSNNGQCISTTCLSHYRPPFSSLPHDATKPPFCFHHG